MQIKNGLFGLLLLGVLMSLPAEGIAEEQDGIISHQMQLNEMLPLEKVVLFSSGVGYFEHRGYVEGNTSLEVSFATEEMADILKSIVLQDYDGGKIDAVQYQPPEPLQRQLKEFSFDLQKNTSLYELLGQARGEQLEIEFGDSQPLTGRILGVETQPGSDTAPPEKQITLYSDGKMVRVSLSSIGSLRFSDPALQKELQEILTVLAGARRTEQRSLTLNFSGEGRREVMVGYIRQMPVWKTTYRLVQRDNEEPLLQGWAIAENSTDFNWDSVQLKLVAGRPISFRMDIYSPLYVTRPELLPPVHTSALPPLYEEGYSEKLALREEAQSPAARRRSAPEELGVMDYRMESSAAEPGRAAAEESYSAGLSAAAGAAEQGAFFAYTIDKPVDLPKRSSALVPIVQQPVEAEALSVFGTTGTASTLAGGSRGAQRPLKSLHLANNTGLHLMGGPLTLFEQGMYAGDAHFDDIVPGGKRLISYAEDLDTQVVEEQKPLLEQIVNLSIQNGVFQYVRKQRRTTVYRLINRGDKPAKLMIQHPKRSGWELVQPEQAEEQTSAHYRFVRDLAPDPASQRLEVVEELPQQRTTRLSNIDSGQISFYLENVDMSGELRSALTRIRSMQQQIERLQRSKNETQSEIDSIYRSQERIRKNMEQLDRDSRLYRQYVAALSQQEEELSGLQSRITELNKEITSTQTELNTFMSNLDIES